MRRLLFAGLFTTLGFSISWNPEFHQFGRNFQLLSGERALASEMAVANLSKKELQSFDLSKIDASKKGLTVKYEISQFGKEKKVAYYVEQTEGDSSETCSDCLGLNKTYIETFRADNIENVELINRLVGEMAVAKISKNKAEDKPVKKEEKKKEEITSACEETTDDSLQLSESDKALLNMSGANTSTDFSNAFACKADEYQTLAQGCQEMMEKSVTGMSKEEIKTELKDRRECSLKIVKYYNKFIKKDLAFGLSAKATPDQLAVAQAFRDGILRNTPNALTGLKNEVLKVSQAGLLERTKAYFVSRMNNRQPTDTPQSIATEAKVKMITEMRSSSSANFCAAFSGAGADECMMAASQPQARAQLASSNGSFGIFNDTYLTPMEKFASAQGGTEAEFDKLIALIGLSTTDQNPTGGTLDPNLAAGMPPAPAGYYAARSGIQTRGGSNALLPTPGSVQATQGQIILPGLSTTQQVQYQAPAQTFSPTPSITTPAAAPAIQVPSAYPSTGGVVGPRAINLPATATAPMINYPTSYQSAPILQPQILPAQAPAIQR